MPPKRPRSHVNADISVAKIQESFIRAGWSAEVLDKDYGEDLLVRIFEEEEATPYTFYVQAKSVESFAALSKVGPHVRYRLDFDHLQHWREFWDPVLLVIWERSTGTAIWDIIQDPALPIDTSGKKAKILVPRSNLLDTDGLDRIYQKTLARHGRYHKEKEGAKVLIETLTTSMDVEVEYDPQNGCLILTHKDETIEFLLFGKLGELAEAIRKERGSTIDEVIREAIKALYEKKYGSEDG